jgi:hypothetical protein
MYFFEWNGGKSLPFLVQEVTHWCLQVDLVLNSIAVYNLDVVQSRNTEIMAAYASVYNIQHG